MNVSVQLPIEKSVSPSNFSVGHELEGSKIVIHTRLRELIDWETHRDDNESLSPYQYDQIETLSRNHIRHFER